MKAFIFIEVSEKAEGGGAVLRLLYWTSLVQIYVVYIFYHVAHLLKVQHIHTSSVQLWSVCTLLLPSDSRANLTLLEERILVEAALHLCRSKCHHGTRTASCRRVPEILKRQPLRLLQRNSWRKNFEQLVKKVDHMRQHAATTLRVRKRSRCEERIGQGMNWYRRGREREGMGRKGGRNRRGTKEGGERGWKRGCRGGIGDERLGEDVGEDRSMLRRNQALIQPIVDGSKTCCWLGNDWSPEKSSKTPEIVAFMN